MNDLWDEFSDADLHVVDLIRAARSGRCVELDPRLFAEYSDEVSDYVQFTYCSVEDHR